MTPDTWDCWCDESPHRFEPDDAAEAVRNLGHMILKEAHIPELVAWLTRKLRRDTE